MNRKLYDENQQLRERSLEQRQQLDNFHTLFQENKQEHERSLAALRQELDESYGRRESESKRRAQHESQLATQQLRERLDEAKASAEASLLGEVAKARQALESELRRGESCEKKWRQAEREYGSLIEKQNVEKIDLESRVRSLEERCELVKRQAIGERQKLEEKYASEREEWKRQLSDLERKIEEVIKEKAQITCKYGQVVETNRELSAMCKSAQIYSEKKVEETK